MLEVRFIHIFPLKLQSIFIRKVIYIHTHMLSGNLNRLYQDEIGSELRPLLAMTYHKKLRVLYTSNKPRQSLNICAIETGVNFIKEKEW